MPKSYLVKTLQTQGQRNRQEDSFVCTEKLLAVADGLGGHESGDLASKAACEAIKYTQNDISAHTLFRTANDAVKMVPRRSIWNYPATTLLVARIVGETVEISNAGDCTALLIRKYSVVRQSTRQGSGSLVTGCLGADDWNPLAETWQLQEDDILLLMTDGFDEAFGLDGTGYTSGDAIDILYQYPPDEALRRLEELTRVRGSTDNATIVALWA